MSYNQDYQNSNWVERITKYEDLREREEYWRLECERKEDNIIRQINEINTKLDALLFAVNTIMHSQTNGNKANLKEKPKVDKLIEKKVKSKIESKERKRKVSAKN